MQRNSPLDGSRLLAHVNFSDSQALGPIEGRPGRGTQIEMTVDQPNGGDAVTTQGSIPTEQPAVRTIAMPADTNPAGDIFGGWVMSQMDLASGNLAALTARGRAATVAVDGTRFHLPVIVGDEVSLFAKLTKRGRSSMHIHVTAWRRSREIDASENVTCATFVFVALDDEGRPRPLPS